jgi:hypothetical protein
VLLLSVVGTDAPAVSCTVSFAVPFCRSAKAPSNWKRIYSAIVDMRKGATAPVDTVGCSKLAEPIGARDGAVTAAVHRFQTLVALMLSAQTKDAVTAAGMRALQSLPNGLTPQSVVDTDEKAINDRIKMVGFHNRKAKSVRAQDRARAGGLLTPALQGGHSPTVLCTVLCAALRTRPGFCVRRAPFCCPHTGETFRRRVRGCVRCRVSGRKWRICACNTHGGSRRRVSASMCTSTASLAESDGLIPNARVRRRTRAKRWRNGCPLRCGNRSTI